MPISFERNVLSESFEQVSLLEPHFEFGLGAGRWALVAGGWGLGAGGWRLEAGGWGLGAGGWRLGWGLGVFFHCAKHKNS